MMLVIRCYFFYWIVVVIHDTSSLKECIVFYSLWKLSVELIFKLTCKLSRLLLLQLAVFFLVLSFMWIIAEGLSFNDVSTFHRCRLIFSNTVEK